QPADSSTSTLFPCTTLFRSAHTHDTVLPLLVPINREAGLNGFDWTFPALAGQVCKVQSRSTGILRLNPECYRGAKATLRQYPNRLLLTKKATIPASLSCFW